MSAALSTLSLLAKSFRRWTKSWLICEEARRIWLVGADTGGPRIRPMCDCRIRFPDPLIRVNDTVKIDLATGKITDSIKFDTGVIAMVTGGRNMGRVGVVTHRERHDGGFNIVHIKDAIDNTFATRESNVFVIGSDKSWISLPKGKGVQVRLGLFRRRWGVEADHWDYSSRLRRSGIVAGLMRWLVTRTEDSTWMLFA